MLKSHPFLFFCLFLFSCSSTFTKKPYEDSLEDLLKGFKIDLDRCYEEEWKKNPELRGALIVGWTIDSQGMVQTPHIVESNLRNPNLEACVLSRMGQWRFPEPEGKKPVVIKEHGFEFEPDDFWDKIF